MFAFEPAPGFAQGARITRRAAGIVEWVDGEDHRGQFGNGGQIAIGQHAHVGAFCTDDADRRQSVERAEGMIGNDDHPAGGGYARQGLFGGLALDTHRGQRTLGELDWPLRRSDTLIYGSQGADACEPRHQALQPRRSARLLASLGCCGGVGMRHWSS
ncbi:MAG: hypothetical protein WDO72_17370 [Pseudomonadota bacterium]